MKTIYKYDPMENALDSVTGDFSLRLPESAQIVHFAPQRLKDGCPKLWIELDPDAEKFTVDFKLIATGEEIPTTEDDHGNTRDWIYTGTAVCLYGEYVWHLYREPDWDLPF